MKKNAEALKANSHDAPSPAPERTTRQKTRDNVAALNENGSACSTGSAAKAKSNTPNAKMRNNSKGSHTTAKSVNSGSKLAHLNLAASKTSQHSRDSSAEDFKRCQVINQLHVILVKIFYQFA